MNKRIKLLAERASLYVDLNGNSWPRAMSAEECESAYAKFAELIVRECMRVADSHGKGWAHLNGTEGNRIRQHFEIAE